MTERAAEFILGLIGGILGILATPVFTFLAVLSRLFGVTPPLSAEGFMITGTVFSITGLIAAASVRSHPKPAGAAMLIIGILGFFVALGFWIGALLLVVAGTIALIRKERPSQPLTLSTSQPTYYCKNCGKPLRYNWQLKRWYCESCDIHAPTREELLRSAMTALEQGDKELAKKFMDEAKSRSE